MHRTEPGGGEIGRVAHQQQHAIAGYDAQRTQRIRRARYFDGELGIAELLLAADQRRARAMLLERRGAEKMLYSVQKDPSGFLAGGRDFRLGS
jgi:hypothetical protein